jgi:site-specific recombinase XerD
MNEPLERTLERYLLQIRPLCAPGSIKTKRSVLRCFTRWLRRHHPDLTGFHQLQRTTHIEPYLQHLLYLKPHSRISVLGRLRLFFEDLRAWGWPQAPPPGLLRPEDFPAPPQLLPKPLAPELDKAITHILEHTHTLPAMGLRLLRLTGMRIGEMQQLHIHALEELAPHTFSLRIPLGKTLAERIIPVCPQTASLFEEIRSQRGSLLPVPPGSRHLLMVDAKGRHLCIQTYNVALKRLTAHLPTSESIHPHRLRHTFATELARANMPLPALMKMLGHLTPRVTVGYVHIAAIDLRNAFNLALQQLPALSGIHPLPPLPSRPSPQPIGPQPLFLDLLASLETTRRDTPDLAQKRQLSRFIKRLRRAHDDLTQIL